MRVLLSNPPWWPGFTEVQSANALRRRVHLAGIRAGARRAGSVAIEGSPDHFVFGRPLPYPFWMGYAATYARWQTGAEVFVRDSIALGESYEAYLNYLATNSFDFLLIESASVCWAHDGEILRQMKPVLPNTQMVVAGPLAQRAEDLLAEYPLRACLRSGEYEKSLVQVLGGASGAVDCDPLSEEEMNVSPFPHYEDVYSQRYWNPAPLGQEAPQAQIWSSRGPIRPNGVVRYYSPDYLDALISSLVERYQYRTISLEDETFACNEAHVATVCEVMAKRQLRWSATYHARDHRSGLAQLLQESGCFGVRLLFDGMEQSGEIENAREAVFELKTNGLTVHALLASPEASEDLVRRVKSMPLDSHSLPDTSVVAVPVGKEAKPEMPKRAEASTAEAFSLARHFLQLDDCIDEACRFIGIERKKFYELAEQWEQHSQQFSSFSNPVAFYESWRGDVGHSNICANILDQFSRIEIGRVLAHLPKFSPQGKHLTFADVSCGTGALSFELAKSFRRAYLTDLPNIAQDFIAWRTELHGSKDVIRTGTLESIDEPIEVMVSVDVLEHIRESSAFFRLMDSKLAPGGLLLFRVPWYSLSPHPEHLPEAEENWKTAGGQHLLETRYRMTYAVPFGGVYQKLI